MRFASFHDLFYGHLAYEGRLSRGRFVRRDVYLCAGMDSMQSCIQLIISCFSCAQELVPSRDSSQFALI